MKLTTRLSSAGEAGFISMPGLLHPAEHYVRGADGRLDEGEVRRELSNHPCVQFSSNDNAASVSFCVEFIDRMKTSIDRYMSTDSSVKYRTKGEKASQAERRFDRGKIVYVSVAVRCGVGGMTVRVSVDNPHDVVGRAEEFGLVYAQLCSDNIVAICDSMKEMNCMDVTCIEGRGCAGMFAKARERVDASRIRNECWDCERRVNGFCSPAKFDCKFYENGYCRWS